MTHEHCNIVLTNHQFCRLVDHLGAMDTAIALCKQACKIPDDEEVTLLEVSRAAPSPLQLLSAGGASLDSKTIAMLLLTDPGFLLGSLGFAVIPAFMQGAVSLLSNEVTMLDGTPKAMLEEPFQQLVNGSVQQSTMFPLAEMQSFDILSSNDVSSDVVSTLAKLVATLGLHR